MAFTLLSSIIVGVILSLWLYGIACHQYFAYWTHKREKQDSLRMRVLVVALFLIDTTQASANCYLLHWSSMLSKDPLVQVLIISAWPLQLTTISQSLTATIVSIILIPRLYRLSGRNIFMVLGLGIFSLATLCVGIAASVIFWTFDFNLMLLPEGPQKFALASNFILAFHSMEVALSFLISGTFIFVLQRSRTGFKRTNSLINTFIRGSLQTSFFPSIFSFIALLTYRYGDLNVSVCIVFILPLNFLYTVSLMDTLLTRETLRQSTNSYPSNAASGVATNVNTIELRVRRDVTVHYGDELGDTQSESPLPASKVEEAEHDAPWANA